MFVQLEGADPETFTETITARDTGALVCSERKVSRDCRALTNASWTRVAGPTISPPMSSKSSATCHAISAALGKEDAAAIQLGRSDLSG